MTGEAWTEYWTSCWIPPTIEELKSDGRWDNLPEDIRESYLRARRYAEKNREKIEGFQAVFRQFLKMSVKEEAK